MARPDRSVLHVLPHAGGGGDTYVDMLEPMPGYRMTRVHLAPARKPGPVGVARGLLELARRARGHDLVHVHGEGAALLLLPLLRLHRSIVTLHGLHLLRRATGARQRIAALNVRAILRAADRTICVSSAEQAVLASAAGSALTEARTTVVHNGTQLPGDSIAAERLEIRAELGIDASAFVGIWVGSLDERRDPVAVARAAEDTGTTLLFVGRGRLSGDVERAARGHVRLLGQRSDVPRLLQAADVFVLMSQREGLSFALVEAMAHGLPAVVADIPENIETIGDSGIAVPYGDADAVANAFRRLAADPAARGELAARARRRAADEFSAEQMIEGTRAVYDRVLGASL
jgi:glycosyltransferase involved in cell wall biosynthesis